MSTKTENLELVKPTANEYYDIAVYNQNMDIIDEELTAVRDEVTEVKKSVSKGKELVAGALTDKGINTATEDTFATMAENIRNIQTGLDTSEATATADTILAGKVAGVKGELITGTMSDNGAIEQVLEINDTYTIPKGYHNGSGRVTQSVPTLPARVYIPNDSIQTIEAGQYLSGTQTISKVFTEEKTITAGVAPLTVDRTTDRYITRVTVNPTPSQHKAVTMTSSPLIISPDSGYLLSDVTVTGSLGRGYATGTTKYTLYSNSSLGIITMFYNEGSGISILNPTTIPRIVLDIDFTPSIVKLLFVSGGNAPTTYKVVVSTDTVMLTYDGLYLTNNMFGRTVWLSSVNYGSNFIKPLSSSEKCVYLSAIDKLNTTTDTAITWEAWE